MARRAQLYIRPIWTRKERSFSFDSAVQRERTMTSVTSFTRTPRGLPRDQWAPCRIEDTLCDETSSLLCGRPTHSPKFRKRGEIFIIFLDHRARDRTPFLFFLPSNNRSKIGREETTRRGEGRGLEKLVKSYRASVSPWRESATASLRPYRCHLEHGEGLASARGRKIGRGRGLKATKRVGGAVPWWPPVRYSFLRVTRADLYDP